MEDDETPSDRLLQPNQSLDHDQPESPQSLNDSLMTTMSKRIQRNLYFSHFLSTWNSRAFEFGAFLFLARLYPDTLLPASVYALARAASAATFSPWIGRYVDTGERLKVIRLSIVSQRVSVALSCLVLFIMSYQPSLLQDPWGSTGLLALLCILACIEKLGSLLNTIAVERDWVITIADGNESRLRQLNAKMRRIDMFCKLAAPLIISFLDVASTKLAITATGIMTAASIVVEYIAIARVYHAVPELSTRPSPTETTQPASSNGLQQTIKNVFTSQKTYINHPAFLPSFALALLYLTVLSFSGQMITYLLSLHTKPTTISLLRALAATLEMSATFLAPALMKRIGPIRTGIWFLNWELLCVTIAAVFLWLEKTSARTDNSTLSVVGLVTAVIASRVGLWGFDLSAQIIVQEEVEPEIRGAFSAQEFAWQNVFEMFAFGSTVVFSRSTEFVHPATMSAVAVAVAGTLYASFVRSRRGHLVHLSRCMERKGGQGGQWRRLAEGEDAVEMDERVM